MTDTNAQLLIKISQLEEDNRAMSMDLKSMELKSCEDLDSLRVEIAALNGKLKAAKLKVGKSKGGKVESWEVGGL